MGAKQRWRATYALLSADPETAAFRTLEAHAANWTEARQHLPRYLFQDRRRYRRISGPHTAETTEA